MRSEKKVRETKETKIDLELLVDGKGLFQGTTGVGFMDHMLEVFCKHSMVDMDLKMTGDLKVDAHHSLEDLGIVLGECLQEALGDKAQIKRYGTFFVPMDEALVMASLDLSGRGFLVLEAEVPTERVGDFETELLPEFLRAFALNAGMTLHVKKMAGINSHHIIEAVFKAVARALREAVSQDEQEQGIPSSKGML